MCNLRSHQLPRSQPYKQRTRFPINLGQIQARRSPDSRCYSSLLPMEVDGLLPPVLFNRVYICLARRYLILDPK